MGVYRYTLRARTKTVSGVEIAHFAFAYKHGWGWERDNAALVARLEAAACRAHDKLTARGVRHFIGYPFGYAEDSQGVPVYCSPNSLPDAFTEEPPASAKRVGTLYRRGGRYQFVNYAAHLVGELRRDGALVFYVTEPDGNGDTRQVEFANCPAAVRYAEETGLAANYIRDLEQRTLDAGRMSRL